MRGTRTVRAFTLIEVILAVFIATGILLVVLFYYHQAANLRTQLLQEAQRLSTIRLLLDRITSDLRCARGDFFLGLGLTGDATTLRLVTTAIPSPAAWQGAELGRVVRPETDLRVVTYSVASATAETNVVVVGFNRSEQPLTEPRESEDAIMDDLVAWLFADEEASAEEPLTDAIRFVQFRYWDGAAWLDAWDSTALPAGVEISFGAVPLPAELTVEEYPGELFRRVVFLPGSGAGNEEMELLELLDEMFGPVEDAEDPFTDSLEEFP